MAVQLNPTVTDPFPQFALYELRRQVFDSLGFIYSKQNAATESPLYFDSTGFAQMGPLPASDGNAQLNSPNSLVYEIKQRLGLPNPVAVAPDVLGNMITQLSNFLGLGAMIKSLPANVIPLLTNFINQAEQDLWRDIELDSGGNAVGATLTNPPARMSTAAVSTTTGTFVTAAVGATQVVAVNSASGLVNGLFMTVTDGVTNITGKITNIAGLNITIQTTVFNTGSIGATMATASLVIVGQMCTLDAAAIMQRAIGLGKLHYGQEDAIAYFEQSKKYVTDYAKRSPPNITSIIQLALIDAQRKILRRIESSNVTFQTGAAYSDTNNATNAAGRSYLVSQFLEPQDSTSIDKEPVFLLALASVKAILKQEDGEEAAKEFERYMAEQEARLPHDAVPFVTNALKRNQETMYRAYKVFRMERWYTWTTAAGVNFYGVGKDDNANVAAPTNLTVTLGSAVTIASMSAKREQAVNILLNNGTVLVAGGSDGFSNLATAEIYTPSTGAFTLTGSMTQARSGAQGVLLSDGRVLICGGFNGDSLASAEIYNPATGTFTLTGSMTVARQLFTVTLLTNGKVLIAGGNNTGSTVYLSSAELYDPTTGLFTATGSMAAQREMHTATLVVGGKVLIAGGGTTAGSSLNTAEVYDPNAGTFSATAATMISARKDHRSLLLATGKVLIVGGRAPSPGITNCELYDPGANTFAATGALTNGRYLHMLVNLGNGKILAAGGSDGAGNTTAELYTINTGLWSATGAMTTPSSDTAALLITANLVIIPGGRDLSGAGQSTAMFYNISGGVFSVTGSLTQGTVYYRASFFNSNGYTIPSLQDASITGVPANTSVVLTWDPPTNLSVTGTAIYGRSVAANTTTSATFVIPAVGASTSVTVTSPTGISINATQVSIKDGTNLVQITVTNVVGSTITFKVTQILSGAAANVMASGATFISGSEQLLTVIPVGTYTWTDNGTIAPNGAMPTSNTTAGLTYSLDPREVAGVYASVNGTNWRQLTNGIPPFVYTTTIQGPPQRYEIRQAIEIWPPPADSTWQIQIKGYFTPLPFASDTDSNSIDPQALYLKTKLDAEIHYKRGDPKATAAELESYIAHLVSGSHNTRRFVPGARELERNATLPVLLGRTS